MRRERPFERSCREKTLPGRRVPDLRRVEDVAAFPHVDQATTDDEVDTTVSEERGRGVHPTLG